MTIKAVVEVGALTNLLVKTVVKDCELQNERDKLPFEI